jgi:hypothetical protein
MKKIDPNNTSTTRYVYSNGSNSVTTMIVPINFNPSSSSSKLPPTLAKISHDEVVLLELQGELELENPSERNGMLVGTLKIDDALVCSRFSL